MFEWLVLVSGTVWEGLEMESTGGGVSLRVSFGVPKVFASVSPSAPSVYLSLLRFLLCLLPVDQSPASHCVDHV